MLEIIGRIVAVIVGILMVINALFMLASPRAWFRLPKWLRAQGTMTEDRYGSGWGAIQVQLAGGLILGAIAWVVYDMFLKHR